MKKSLLPILLLTAAAVSCIARTPHSGSPADPAVPADRSDAAATACGTTDCDTTATTVIRGRVVFSHEVRAFTPEGDTTEYWLQDRGGVLEEAYDRLTGGVKNGTPVRAELRVRYLGPSDEGFAAEYAGVYRVMEIIRLERESPDSVRHRAR